MRIEKTVKGGRISYEKDEVIFQDLEPVTVITRLAFMEKFTTPELVAIYTEAKTAVELEVFLDKVKAADEVDLTDSRTREGVAVLASMGLIGEGRAVEILAGA